MPTYNSVQLTDGFRKYPIDDHGKMRIQHFYYINDTGAALVDGSQIDLCKLPPGRKRIIPNLSRYRTTAFGAARVLNIGHRAYYALSTPPTSPATAENLAAFVAAKDVSAAVADVPFDAANGMKIDMYSRGETTVSASVTGGTIPVGGIVSGIIVYVVE